MANIEVIHGGMLSTFQDVGRFSGLSEGYPRSGVVDYESMYYANRLVDQDVKHPVLEMTYTGVELRFHTTLCIAITGGTCDIWLNEVLMPMYQTILINSGDHLKMGAISEGMRTYMSFSATLDLQACHESYSTYLAGAIGGFKGRQLKSEDRITVLESRHVNLMRLSPLQSKGLIRVLTCYEYGDFDQEVFLENTYTITHDINRMGMRIKGSPLVARNGHDIISEPLVPGTIQIPQNGQPIIMLSEAQTIGGYKRIGTVLASDLCRLSQMRPLETLRFEYVSLKEAKIIKKQWLDRLQSIKLSPIQSYGVRVNNQKYYVTLEAIL